MGSDVFTLYSLSSVTLLSQLFARMRIVSGENLVGTQPNGNVEMAKKLIKIVLCILILGAGAAVFAFFATTRTEAERKPLGQNTAIVEVTRVEAVRKKTVIQSMGTIIPARKVTLVPEVAGRIVFQSKKLVPGGIFRKGQVVLRLDSRDYQLAVKQRRAQVTKAEMELAVENGQKVVAEQEWSLISDDVKPTKEGRKLALREAQVETAEAALTGAESALTQAEIAQGRTVLRAPFNAIVTEEFVDEGQVVGPSSQVATLVDRDKFWVRVAVPIDRLAWISFPGSKGKTGSKATVLQKVGNSESVTRHGRVVQLLRDLDPVGKMARVLVEVGNPIGELGAGGDELPLLIGAYVSVEIEGPELDNVFSIPRRGMREGDTVWVKNKDSLEFKKVETIWTEKNSVYVRGPLRSGEEIIVSRISAPVEGMRVSLENEAEARTRETSKSSGPPQ